MTNTTPHTIEGEIEQLARQLHVWYLDATKKLSPESYNLDAQKSYADLTEEQKFIDRYIAEKVLSHIAETAREEEREKIINLIEDYEIRTDNGGTFESDDTLLLRKELVEEISALAPDYKHKRRRSMKVILDACCGGRMFWFNKKHPNALYIDIREEQDFQTGKGVDNRHRAILPDKVMDFRKMELPDNSFSLVVFDPPHLKIGRKSYFAQIYGSLEDTWQEDIRKGFAECFRVLKPEGVLIFKWNESDIPLREILALTNVQPLFGHRSGKAAKTHWITFMKLTPTPHE